MGGENEKSQSGIVLSIHRELHQHYTKQKEEIQTKLDALKTNSDKVLEKVKIILEEGGEEIKGKSQQNQQVKVKRLETHLSAHYSKVVCQDQQAPLQGELSFERYLIGFSADDSEFKTFIFSDGSRTEFTTQTPSNYFRETRL